MNISVRSFGLLTALCCVVLSAKLAPADEPKTKSVSAGDLKLEVPEDWKQKPDVRNPRVGEFQVPPVGEDKEAGEIVVFYFGPEGAGDLKQNIERWKSQFEADGRQVEIYTGEGKQGKYSLVDLTGTFKKPIGPPIRMQSKRLEGWRVLQVILETEKGPFFLRYDGPAKSVGALEEKFRAAFGAKKDGEKKQEAKAEK